MFRVFCLAFCLHCCPLLTATAQDNPGNTIQPSSTVQPPNIVLVITDDQGYPVIGRHGHPWIRTPHLDALHDSSTRFTRFLVSPTCSPTRSALMTGRHSMRNGITHTILERERLTLDAVTLPQVLKSVGYTTGIFGKWHLGDEEDRQPHQRGFDEVFIHGAGGIGQAYNCSCADVPDNSYFNPIVRHNTVFRKTEGFCTDVFFTAALDWIHTSAASDRPFFAYIAPNAPHGPWLAPPEWKKRFLEAGFTEDQAGFYGMIENIDANMGRLMTVLADHKLLEKTVVIFMSDNGMTGGGSGRPGLVLGRDPAGRAMPFYNAGMKGLKGSPEEGGLRVPFFVRADGRWPAGREIDRIAGDIDIAPTLAALAGTAMPPAQSEGRSLLPLLNNPAAAWEDRYLMTHVGRWETGAEPNDFQWKNFSVRNQRFRLVNDTQLYDMQADPGQTKNVIADFPQEAAAMHAAWDAWWKQTRPLMVNETAPLSPTRPWHELFRAQQAAGGIGEWKPRSSSLPSIQVPKAAP
jgi:arylsulfatase